MSEHDRLLAVTPAPVARRARVEAATMAAIWRAAWRVTGGDGAADADADGAVDGAKADDGRGGAPWEGEEEQADLGPPPRRVRFSFFSYDRILSDRD